MFRAMLRRLFLAPLTSRPRVTPPRPRRRPQLEFLEDRTVPSVSVMTNLHDYAPGDTAYITASGFQKGETVQFHVMHADGLVGGEGHLPWRVTDGSSGDLDGLVDGNILTSWFVQPDDSLGATFLLTATGFSGFAQTTFTDAPPAQFSGAIFTTLSDGTTVNQNIYASKTDVYLNGGPQNQNSAGLPDGTYYFQVTEPDGTLLSTDDAVNRQVLVSGGVIAGAATAEILADGGTAPHANGTQNTVTGAIPVQLFPFADTSNPGGEYKVWLIIKSEATISTTDPKVLIFSPSDSKTDNFKVETDGGGGGGTTGSISGMKFYDQNTDGVFDTGELGINGWTINLYEESGDNPGLQVGEDTFVGTMTTATIGGVHGKYTFSGLDNGTYYVTEGASPYSGTWIQTTPLDPDYYTVVISNANNATNRDFGNVKLGAGGGLTLGFWSNRNGQRLITADDLQALRDLNLRNADGTNFNPTSAAELKSWLLNATATNMAYMLSAQLAAMKLNVLHGFVNGDSLIYAPGTNSANQAGFATVSDIIAESNAALLADGYTPAGDPNRAYQELLKNALDSANNNLNFVLKWVDLNNNGVPEAGEFFTYP